MAVCLRQTSKALLILLHLCLFMQSPLVAGDITLSDLIDGIEMRSQCLDSMSARVQSRCYKIQSLAQLNDPDAQETLTKSNYEVCTKGKKVSLAHEYLCIEAPAGQPERTNFVTWDGRQSRGYNSDWNTVSPKSGGVILGKRAESFSLGHYLSALEMVLACVVAVSLTVCGRPRETGPAIRFAQSSFDAGVLTGIENSTVQYVFEFQNTGNRPLEVLDIKTNCGCS